MFQEFGFITHKRCIAPGIYRLTIDERKIAEIAIPGQFVMVKCYDGQSFLRRPFSIVAETGFVFGQQSTFNLIFKVVGRGTQWLSGLEPGYRLDMIGPLGNGYALTEAVNKKILLVAGGIGIVSLTSVAVELIKIIKIQGLTSIPKVQILFGDKTSGYDGNRHAHYIESLIPWSALGKLIITTEDGSVGQKGMVTDILVNVIKEKGIEQIFACGPKAMLKKVAEISQSLNLPCQVCLEERMACGVGACYSCVCKVKGHNMRVCKDGPVFEAKEVDWS